MAVQADALLKAALDLKYLLDIQPAGSLFHPSGRDARLSSAYRQASMLIGQPVGDGFEVVQRPYVVSGAVPTWVDVEAKHCTDVPTSTC